MNIKSKLVFLMMAMIFTFTIMVSNDAIAATINNYEKNGYKFNVFILNGYTSGSFLKNTSSQNLNNLLILRNKNGKYGVVDIKGNIKVPFKYDEIRSAYGNYIIALLGGKYGILDLNGKIVVDFGKYEDITSYPGTEDNIFVYKDGINVPLDSSFIPYSNLLGPVDSVTVLDNDLLLAESNGKRGIFKKSGQVVLPMIYDSISIIKRDISIRTTYFVLSKDEEYTLADSEGKILLPEGYQFLNDYTNSNILIVKKEKYRLFDLDTENFVGNSEFDFLGRHNDNTFLFSEGNQYGLIDAKSEILESFVLDNGYVQGRVVNGLYQIREGDEYLGTFYYVDSTGKIVSSEYDYFSEKYSNTNGLIAVQRFDKRPTHWGEHITWMPKPFYNGDEYLPRHYGFIDATGKEIVKCKYDFVWVYENWIEVRLNGKKGFIDSSGKEFAPLIYDDVRVESSLIEEEWSNRRAFVQKGGKWGIIDNFGSLVFPCELDQPPYFVDGFSICFRNGKIGAIDINGKIVVPFMYDSQYSTTFKNDLAVLAQGVNSLTVDGKVTYAKYGVINTKGEVIIPCQEMFMKANEENTAFLSGINGALKVYQLVSKPSINGNPVEKIAKPTGSSVLIDGKKLSFEAYGIDGYNYFKLRDIAMALNGSNKQFEVSWDGSKNAINITKGKAYSIAGGELRISDKLTDKDAKKATSSVYINDREVKLEVYTIDGYNYFKLRDLGKKLNFNVKWDGNSNSIIIDSTSDYIG